MANVNSSGALDLLFESEGQIYSFGINPIGALVLYNQSTHTAIKEWK